MTKQDHVIVKHKKVGLEKSSTDGYIKLLMGYPRSPFRDFAKYHRIVVGLDEEDIQLILKQNISNFVTYELSPSIHSIEDTSKAVYTMGDHERTLQIEYDDNSIKAKLKLTRFDGTLVTQKFDEKTFLFTLLGFTPYWDFEPNNAIHADKPGVYTSDKILNLSTIVKLHLNCDCIDGSILDGYR